MLVIGCLILQKREDGGAVSGRFGIFFAAENRRIGDNMKIINLTQHQATEAQIKEGVFNANQSLNDLLTFITAPSEQEMVERAEKLADIAAEAKAEAAMIGGAGYFMRPLEEALRARGIRPLYSFSERRSVEKHNPDGTVVKTNVFEHVGWVG